MFNRRMMFRLLGFVGILAVMVDFVSAQPPNFFGPPVSGANADISTPDISPQKVSPSHGGTVPTTTPLRSHPSSVLSGDNVALGGEKSNGSDVRGNVMAESGVLPPPTPNQTDIPKKTSRIVGLLKTAATLLFVLAILFGGVWLLKKSSPQQGGMLPEEVVSVVGHLPFTGRRRLTLLRVGTKLVLVAVGSDSVETLTEITDPNETAFLLKRCRSGGGP